MTWRSFHHDTEEKRAAITSDWKVVGYPTLYLIDHHGIIRKRWIGGPTAQELTHMAEVLIDAARHTVGLEAMPAVVKALPIPPRSTNHCRPTRPRTSGPHPTQAFFDKVFREADGSEAMYVVFVPPDYTGDRNVPAILFLHGAGRQGADGRSHTPERSGESHPGEEGELPVFRDLPASAGRRKLEARSAGGKSTLAILKAGAVRVSH